MSTANFKIDFSGVSESLNSKFYCVPGNYAAKVTKCELGETKSSGEKCLKWEFEVISPSQKGKVLSMMTVLTASALWKLKQVLEAMGYNVPKSLVTITPTAYIGKVVAIEVKDRVYEGKTYSDIKTVSSISTLSDDGVTVSGVTVSMSEDSDDDEIFKV